MAAGMDAWVFMLAALGLWFVAEGLVYSVFPDTMRRFLDWAARQPTDSLRSGGLWTAALGGLMLYIAIRLMR